MRLRHLACCALSLLFTLVLATAGPVGCLGPQARDGVGLPTLELTEPGVFDDIAVGIATLPAEDQAIATAKLGTFRDAVRSGDRTQLVTEALPRWSELRGYADAGIAARVASGSIGAGVGKSLTERLDRFGEVLTKTAGPDP